jgi:hypothetical protein
MADDMKRVVRQDEVVVAGAPQQETVVTQTPAVVPGTPVAPVVPAAQTTVQATTTPPGDRVVARTATEAVIDPAAERAASVDWVSRLIWFLVGVLDVLIAIRFVLLLAGANAAVGFAQLIYGVTTPFVGPFLGLFGKPITYEGAAQTAQVEFESLVAIVVWTLIGWVIVKVAQLLLGTNRNRGTVVSDVDRRTRI